MQVLKGAAQVHLKWNYLKPTGWNISQTVFSIWDGRQWDTVGIINHLTANTEVFNRFDYQTRFAISTSEVATLIINQVTKREETIFKCKLVMVSGLQPSYDVRLKLTGKDKT